VVVVVVGMGWVQTAHVRVSFECTGNVSDQGHNYAPKEGLLTTQHPSMMSHQKHKAQLPALSIADRMTTSSQRPQYTAHTLITAPRFTQRLGSL
jgi:hypothetical protein